MHIFFKYMYYKTYVRVYLHFHVIKSLLLHEYVSCVPIKKCYLEIFVNNILHSNPADLKYRSLIQSNIWFKMCSSFDSDSRASVVRTIGTDGSYDTRNSPIFECPLNW